MAEEMTILPKYSIGDVIYQKNDTRVKCFIICGIDTRMQKGSIYYVHLNELHKQASVIDKIRRADVFYTVLDENENTTTFSEESIDKNFCLSLEEYKKELFEKILKEAKINGRTDNTSNSEITNISENAD